MVGAAGKFVEGGGVVGLDFFNKAEVEHGFFAEAGFEAGAVGEVVEA